MMPLAVLGDREGGRVGRISRERALDGEGLGQAEVEDLHDPVGSHLHVGGLQVAVDDAALVGVLEGLRHLPGDGQRLLQREPALRDALGQGDALDELHDEGADALRLLEPVDDGDVRVLEAGQEAGLPLEPREAVGIAGRCRPAGP